MKAFGVRLAAGIVTIMFGAYAAVLAQKDKQNNSETWTAEAPSLGEPALPIADMDDPSWISQPVSATTNALAQAADAFRKPDRNQSSGPVQLVQHTESTEDDIAIDADRNAPAFNMSMSPPALAAPAEADEPMAILTPDWAMPAPSNDPASSHDPATRQPMSTTDPISESAEPTQEMPELSFADTQPMKFFAAEQGQSAVAQELPPGVAPTPEMATPGMAAPGMAAPGMAAPEMAAPEMAGTDGGYENVLRGTDDGANLLRSGPPSMPSFDPPSLAESNPAARMTLSPSDFEPPSEPAVPSPRQQGPEMIQPQEIANLALQSPGFGQSAQQFDQPAPIRAAPAAALGTSPYNNTPPLRVASLPNSSAAIAPGYSPDQFQQPDEVIEIDPTAVVDSPGDRRLEGIQSPSIVIQKRAPSEVKVGKPASFVIHVQNVGTVEALQVRVHDKIPAGMRLIDASPAPVQQGNVLMWQLGAMPAGDERTVTMQLVPEQEGELGSVARVTFEAAASVRTISTRPELKIVQTAPEKVLIGQQLEIELEVSNPGTGEATGVVLQEDVPDGLEHPKGRQLDNLIGNLAPGEVRRQVLRMRAVSAGVVQNLIRLSSDDGLTAQHMVSVEVIAPQLQVDLTGPSRRFLERQATYQVEVANLGTADATNVELAVQLDRGFTFVSTDYEGQYDPSRHAVYWSLANLPAGGSGSVPLTLLPVQEGERALVMDARADLGAVAKNERAVTVEGFAELSFQITNPGGPIELGAETSYEIVVTNSGSKADSNVRVQLKLPTGLELLSADGDAGTDGRGLVVFQPKPQLAQGGEIRYRIRVRGTAPGTHLVKAVVVSDQATVPVTKEESTLVYADQ